MSYAKSPPQVLSSRDLSFDLARGLAVLFMILIHVSDFYGEITYQSSDIATVFKFLGKAPAAPVFMFIMGVFLIVSPNESLSNGLKRASWIFALGYLLNFFRGSLPMWLSLQSGIVTQEMLGPYTPVTELLADVTQQPKLFVAQHKPHVMH